MRGGTQVFRFNCASFPRRRIRHLHLRINFLISTHSLKKIQLDIPVPAVELHAMVCHEIDWYYDSPGPRAKGLRRKLHSPFRSYRYNISRGPRSPQLHCSPKTRCCPHGLLFHVLLSGAGCVTSVVAVLPSLQKVVEYCCGSAVCRPGDPAKSSSQPAISNHP